MTFPDSSNRGAASRTSAKFMTHLGAAAALLALSLSLSTAVLAFDPFVVKDIRVEGVQRTDAGTVLSYLPIKVGDRIDDEKASAAVKGVYATGFFRDCRVESERGRLVGLLPERPSDS